MKKRLAMVLFGCGLLLLHAPTAEAVILFLKGSDEPVRGYLVRQDASVVVFRELKRDGSEVERTVLRSQIDDLITTVSADRLAALKKSEPDGYREYAEELAEKRKDPDAQLTGIRLFLIAAYLEPERLGRSCLLGMVSLARNETEQRRFRAMSYLLDPAHDRNQLRTTSVQKPIAQKLEPRHVRLVVRALRLLRQNKKKDARLQARRINMKERLPLVTDLITYDEFDEACESICPHCRRGRVDCPDCQGKGFVLDGESRRVTCRTCGARGDVVCPDCDGAFSDCHVSASLLNRIIQVELAWLSDGKEPASSDAILRPSWSRTVQDAALAPAMPLTLEKLTEFDPRQCHFRDGNWTE